MKQFLLKNRMWMFAIAILLVSFLIQVWLISNLQFVLADDQGEYQFYREQIAQGKNYYDIGIRPPVYPYFSAFLYQISPETNLVSFTQLVGYMGLCVAFFLVARKLFGEKPALVTLFLLAFYPGLIYFNITLFSDGLFTLLSMLGFLCGVLLLRHFDKDTPGRKWLLWTVLAAILLCLGYMTRSAAVFSLLALVVTIFWFHQRRRILVPGLLVSIFVLLAIPMFWSTYQARGYWGSPESNFWWALYLGNNPSDRVVFVWQGGKHTPILEKSAEDCRDPVYRYKAYQDCTGILKETVLNEVKTRPLLAFARIFGKAFDFWTLERSFAGDVIGGAFGPPSMAAFILVGGLANLFYLVVLSGGITGLWIERKSGSWVVYAMGVLLFTTFGIALVTWGHPRYHKPLIPILALFAGPGLIYWLERGKSFWKTMKLKRTSRSH